MQRIWSYLFRIEALWSLLALIPVGSLLTFFANANIFWLLGSIFSGIVLLLTALLFLWLRTQSRQEAEHRAQLIVELKNILTSPILLTNQSRPDVSGLDFAVGATVLSAVFDNGMTRLSARDREKLTTHMNHHIALVETSNHLTSEQLRAFEFLAKQFNRMLDNAMYQAQDN